MKQETKYQRLVILLARNHKPEEIKTLLNMKSKNNKEFMDFVELVLSYEGYKEFYIQEKISVMARELKVENTNNLPF